MSGSMKPKPSHETHPNVEARPQLLAHLKSDPGSKLKRGG